MINIHNIFSLFPSASKDDEAEKDSQLDFNENPIYWVKMFRKIVDNHVTYKEKIIASFTKTEIASLDTEDVERAGEFIAYNRAWIYIYKIDMKKPSHSDSVFSNSDLPFIKTLNSTIHYFEKEGIEEYEKCAFLKDILDKVKTYYKKFGSLKKV